MRVGTLRSLQLKIKDGQVKMTRIQKAEWVPEGTNDGAGISSGLIVVLECVSAAKRCQGQDPDNE